MKPMAKDYSSNDIKVLDDREHVRIRTQLYMGSMEMSDITIPVFRNKTIDIVNTQFIPAVYKSIGEIIDNSIDEFQHIKNKKKLLRLQAHTKIGQYIIQDNGRGIPIDKHELGKPTPEVVFSLLRSGRNFDDNNMEAGVIGQNGVGSSCVNFLSKEFIIDIHRDGKHYHQVFESGGSDIFKPITTKDEKSSSGTRISFKLDDEIFTNVEIPEYVMRNRAIELAFTNPGITVEYSSSDEENPKEFEKFKFNNGLSDIVRQISMDNDGFHRFHYENEDTGSKYEFFVIFDINKDEDEKIFTWVNSSLLFEGGICNTQFMNGFVDRAMDYLNKLASKRRIHISKSDIRQNLLILGNIKITNPKYNSQSKLFLTGPNMRKELDTMIDMSWTSFARKNKQWLETVLERAEKRHRVESDKKAIKELKKSKKDENLIDATSRIRKNCILFITEGLSASREIQQVRDSKTMASLPLSGKINNVYGSSVADVMKMGKVAGIMNTIGLIPNQKATSENIRYGKIIITPDADPDGSDIMSLLVNFFYQFWPELFDPNLETPLIYRLEVPNIALSKGKKRIHFSTREDYENRKSKYNGYTVSYYKGLGSMLTSDWRMIMENIDDYLIPFIDDGKMKETLALLFDENADTRKKWLQNDYTGE
jgi:DNA gyrase/topoisomerase IV subunit B